MAAWVRGWGSRKVAMAMCAGTGTVLGSWNTRAAWAELYPDHGYPKQPSMRDPTMPHINTSKLRVIAGSGNPRLAEAVASALDAKVTNARIGQFADGETEIQVLDNVRGKDCYIVQSTGRPINDNLVELLLLISTLRRASATRITAVIPYYGYARQDRKRESRETIAAADVARMLEAMGVDRVLAIDLHREQLQGFFRKMTPVENLSTTSSLAVPYFVKKNLHRPVIISPSGTGVHRAIKLRDELKLQGIEAGLAFVSPNDNRGVLVSNVTHHHRVHEKSSLRLVGDVHDSDVILVDDMVDTGSRLEVASRVCEQEGALRIFAFATHGVLSGDQETMERIQNSPICELVLCNTLPEPSPELLAKCPKITYLSVASLLADAIFRLHTGLPLAMSPADYAYALG